MQVAKWGNSLAVRLPKKLVDEMKLKPGDELNVVKAEGGSVAVEKVGVDLSGRCAVGERFTKAMEQFRWPASNAYKFDRDEANER